MNAARRVRTTPKAIIPIEAVDLMFIQLKLELSIKILK